MEVVIAVLLSFILIRLLKGPWISSYYVYHRFTWFLLMPVFWLRSFNNTYVLFAGYCLVWIYVISCKSYILRDRLTFFFGGFWGIIGWLPFVPAGWSVFSLAHYSLSSVSLFAFVVLYLLLFVVYLLIFHYYFGRGIMISGWWAFLVALLIIILNTVAVLAPQIASQPFLSSLNYTTHRFTSFLNARPIALFLCFAALFWVCLGYLRSNLIAGRRSGRHFPVWITPLAITIVLAILIGILNQDMLRYRKYDYRQGINTIYMSKLENHVMTWCNNRHFGFILNSVKLIYPFTFEHLPDSLARHALRLSRLTIIEGMDFFRYERLLHVLAYGPRDSLLYRRVRPLLKNRYFSPKPIRAYREDVLARYCGNADDISVEGSVEINGKPLVDVRYQVALFDGSVSVPVWMARTDQNGRFSFDCHNPERSENYVNIHFLLPDSLIHGRIAAIELAELPPLIDHAGHYQLDTFRINIVKDNQEKRVLEVHVYARSALTGFYLALPEDYAMPTRINALTTVRGFLRNVEYYTPIQDSVDIVDRRMRRSAENWRFYSAGSVENQVEVYLNYNRH